MTRDEATVAYLVQELETIRNSTTQVADNLRQLAESALSHHQRRVHPSGDEASHCDCDNGRVQFTNGVPCPKCRKSTSSDVLDSIDASGNDVEETKS